MDYLENFFKKSNKALLDKLAVERQRDRLRKENADLQSILKQYLDGISVNERSVEETKSFASCQRPCESECTSSASWRCADKNRWKPHGQYWKKWKPWRQVVLNVTQIF